MGVTDLEAAVKADRGKDFEEIAPNLLRCGSLQHFFFKKIDILLRRSTGEWRALYISACLAEKERMKRVAQINFVGSVERHFVGEHAGWDLGWRRRYTVYLLHFRPVLMFSIQMASVWRWNSLFTTIKG